MAPERTPRPRRPKRTPKQVADDQARRRERAAQQAHTDDLAQPFTLPLAGPVVDVADQLGNALLDDVYLVSEEWGSNRRAKEIEREEQREKVLQLRRTGASIRAIAAQLGLTVHKTHALKKEAISSLCPPESREEVRAFEVDRIDRALLAIWQQVAQGDLEAIRVMDRLVNTRIRLCGLDQIQVEVRTDPLALTSRAQVERAILEKVHRVREQQQWGAKA